MNINYNEIRYTYIKYEELYLRIIITVFPGIRLQLVSCKSPHAAIGGYLYRDYGYYKFKIGFNRPYHNMRLIKQKKIARQEMQWD